MSAARVIGRGVLGVCAVALVVLSVGAAGARAELPWWHLAVQSRPASIQPGSGRSEVQELTASAGEFAGLKGAFFALKVGGKQVGIFATGEFIGAFGSVEASAENIQKALEGEEGYGAGNVVVTGGPAASAPLVIRSVNGDANRPVAPIEAEAVASVGSASVRVTTLGRADGEIVLTAANLGDAVASGERVPVSVVDRLPAGLTAVAIERLASGGGNAELHGPGACSLAQLTCTYEGPVAPYSQFEVAIAVNDTGVVSGALDEASVSGGLAQGVSVKRPLRVGEAPGFGVEQYEISPEEEGGLADMQAGSHPFQLTTTLTLNQTAEAQPVALAKDLHFKLPPGLIGNPTPFPRCTMGAFLHFGGGTRKEPPNQCPAQTAVGVAVVTINLEEGKVTTLTQPLFNLEPGFGEPARFGFVVGGVPVLLDTALRTGGDYGVTVNVNNISQEASFLRNEVTFWGVPGDPRHDAQRGWGCLFDTRLQPGEAESFPCSPLEGHRPPPLLELPTSCTGVPLRTEVEADSWYKPGAFGSLVGEPMPIMDGCNRLPFTPSIKVTPDGTAGSTPTGLTVDEHVPQEVSLNGQALGESAVKGLSVTLPEGVGLNPAGADGLQACSLEAFGLLSAQAPTCPEAAKVATVRIKTPLLSEPLEGEAYLAAQNANPFGSLVALYIDAENATEGIRAKATGEVLENPVTGQLTAHFEGDPVFEHDPAYADEPEAQSLPELPFEDVELHFFGGDRAPLGTPAKCGSYTTTGTFVPWSGNPTTESSSTFNITSGPNGSPCANPLPFNPTFTAGTTSIQAGGFTPFEMTMSREDGEQSLQGIQLKMPLGMSGTLSKVKLCGEAQANAGTCGPESEIGETIVSVGLGGDPYTVKGGKVYITGPYRGAPYGLSIVNPAKAGPFNLGYVVVRARIEVNEETAALTITTDDEGPYKIPTIIDGIPLQIKHVNVNVNRPGFTFNATNCSPLSVTGDLRSTEGSTAALSAPYQVTNCAVLAFKPKLTAKTSGKTSRANGASLSVKLTYPAGPYDANIARVKVDLPKQLPSRLTTLQQACPAKTFEANPAECPAASIVGHATATTPVLPVPLTGPAYFVSHGGEEFPDLIIVLQGYGATVHLVGSTFISKAGVTSSTFKRVPDVPVGTFELTLPQGKYSALAANGNLCTAKNLAMPTAFVGQNGAEIHQSTKISVTGCPKGKKSSKHHKGKSHGKKK